MAETLSPGVAHRRLTALVTTGCLLVVVAGLAAVWLVSRSPDPGERQVSYGNARTMARQLGCLESFERVPDTGSSTTSGRCTTAAGAELELRTFTDGLPAADHYTRAPVGQAVLGCNWTVRVLRGGAAALAEARAALGPSLPCTQP